MKLVLSVRRNGSWQILSSFLQIEQKAVPSLCFMWDFKAKEMSSGIDYTSFKDTMRGKIIEIGAVCAEYLLKPGNDKNM